MPGPVRTIPQDGIDMGRIIHQALHFAGHRSDLFNREVRKCRLEYGKLLAAEHFNDGKFRRLRKRCVNPDQIVRLRPFLERFQRFGQGCRIGLGLADFLCNRVGIICHYNTRKIGRVGLRHFLRTVAKRHDARGRSLDDRVGHGKISTVMPGTGNLFGKIIVELGSDITGQFEMLLLVIADRHMGGAVQQDVGSHKCGVGEQAYGSVFTVAAGLFLELGHPVEPAHARDAVEHPCQFGMLGNLALVEDDVLFRVDPGSQIGSGHLANVSHQLARILPDGDRMKIDNAVNAFMAFLQRDKFADCT